jgi:hypothetical protein
MNLSVPEERLARSEFWYFDPAKWPVYRQVIEKAQALGIPFSMGGGFAQMTYTGWPREARDVDLFVLPHYRDKMIRITRDAGLDDYYDDKPYDREWIYRSAKGDVIVDLIWAMANKRAEVDGAWVERGPEIKVDGVRFRLIPPEELLWIKLYIVQRDRSDWPDALNLLYSRGPELDWRHVLTRLGADRSLLTGLLAVFSWLCPDRARQLPDWLWAETGLTLPRSSGGLDLSSCRADLLDSRPWLVPAIQMNGRE